MAFSPDVKTPLARLAFANIFKARANQRGEEMFDCTLLFDKGTKLDELVAAVRAVAQEAWGDKGVEGLKNGIIKNPFLDGDGPQGLNKKTGERLMGFDGKTFIRTSTKRQPKVFDQKVQPVISPEEVYSGCYVYAVVHAYSWEHDQNGRGISFGITMLQKAKDGEKFGGGERAPGDFFETVETPDTATAAKTSDGAAGLFA